MAVRVEDGRGEAVFSLEPERRFSWLLVSDPALRAGESYTLYVEGTAVGAATVDGALNAFLGDDLSQDDEAPSAPSQGEPSDGAQRI